MNDLNRGSRRPPRSVWLPTLLLLYLLAMTGWFGAELIRNGETTRLIIVFVVELIVIGLLYFFLKKRERRE